MKYLSILAGMLFLLTAQQCKTSDPGSRKATATANYTETTNMLQSTWLHSYEEDTEGLKTYRPNTYDFPPSRGRTGFAFEPGGKFIQYDIAPTDGLEGKEGMWQMKDAKTVAITFPPARGLSNYEIQIVSMDKNKLVVKTTEQ